MKRRLKSLGLRSVGMALFCLLALNAGPGRVPRGGRLILPAETRAYLARVLR